MIKSRIKFLKKLLDRYNVDGYIVPSTDEYMSEYTPKYARRLEYITGFTGSNGIAIILKDITLFFTDGRYLEQSKIELDLGIFKIFNLKDLDRVLDDYKNMTFAYDPKLFSYKTLKIFTKLKLHSLTNNLIDEIWEDQPTKPNSAIYIYSEEFTGISHVKKIESCQKYLENYSAEALVITEPDSICWLLNLRAHDIEFSPLILGFVVVTNQTTYLFVEPTRVSNPVIDARPEVTILPENRLADFLSNLDGKVLIDQDLAPIFIVDLLKNKQNIENPCKLAKSCKTDVEIKHSITNHIKDAVALCEFLAWLSYETIDNLTEYDLSLKLTEFRKIQSNYIMDSFPTICGFKENGAIIHYHPYEKASKKIAGDGLLLIDSGAQYLGTTTDITRTIPIGTVTFEEKQYYTKVLKGHIALSMIKFPFGITGSNLDVLARQYLWQSYDDYAHGTGHGVGSFLSVHEGPQNINLGSNVVLRPNMIISNEPGYYLSGKFGIRIENLMYVTTAANPSYLEFKTLSLVPYSKKLIDFSMITFNELEYIKQYYREIQSNIFDLLSDRAKKWLEIEFQI